jgi:hypothetical protein
MACLCHASTLIYSVIERVISEAKPKDHGDLSTSTNSADRHGGQVCRCQWGEGAGASAGP